MKPLSFELGGGFLLSRLGAMAERDWNLVISAVGLTQSEFHLLTILEELGPMRQRDLALRAALDPRNAVLVVSKLTKRGYVTAQTDSADRRAKQLAISDVGLERLKLLRKRLVPERERFFAPLTADEYRQLCALLAQVYQAHVSSGS